MKKLVKGGWVVLKRRGPGYFGYLLTGYLMPRLSYNLLHGPLGPQLRRAIESRPTQKLTASDVRRRAAEVMQSTARAKFTTLAELPLDAEMRAAIEEARALDAKKEIELGRVTGGGRAVGSFGELPFRVACGGQVSETGKPSALDVVLVDDDVLLRKSFEDSESFLSEWLAHALSYGKANVAVLHHVDEEQRRIYKNLLLGPSLKEMKETANHDDVQAKMDAASPNVSEFQTNARNNDSAAKLHAHFELPEDALRKLERQLEAIHAVGVTGVSFSPENIVAASDGELWIADLAGARAHGSRKSLSFAYLRNEDRARFNQEYGAALLTEESAREALRAQKARLTTYRDYAPIDFGGGLSIGLPASTDSGTGRWEFFNGPVLTSLIKGKRVLDLGSNNGSMPLSMLRSGAREVFGVEMSPELAAMARLNCRIFEWRDMREYSLHIHEGNMLDFLTAEWGRFDVITAYCSLYYLEAEEMAKIVRRAREMGAGLVLQANTALDEILVEKASPEFLKRLLEENGYADVEVHAPQGYARPLLIGRAS